MNCDNFYEGCPSHICENCGQQMSYDNNCKIKETN